MTTPGCGAPFAWLLPDNSSAAIKTERNRLRWVIIGFRGGKEKKKTAERARQPRSREAEKPRSREVEPSSNRTWSQSLAGVLPCCSTPKRQKATNGRIDTVFWDATDSSPGHTSWMLQACCFARARDNVRRSGQTTLQRTKRCFVIVSRLNHAYKLSCIIIYGFPVVSRSKQ